MKTIILDGNSFSDINGFYDEVERKILTGDRWGRNLDAFNDILRGGFGILVEDANCEIIWLEARKSSIELNEFQIITDIIRDQQIPLVLQ